MTIISAKASANNKQLETKVLHANDTETKAVETKATGNEVANAFEDFMRAFESYKETNDERLAKVEQRIDAVLALADRVTMIENGKSVETLTAKELGASPDKIKRYLGV